MKRSLICLTVVIAIVLATVPALAGSAPVLDKIVERGELRIGMTGNQPPLNVKSKSGKLIGFEVDLAEILASAMGVKSKIIVKPFAELLPALEAGEVDMVMSGMTITPERNLRAAFVGPYMVSGKSILTKSSTLALVDETGDMNAENITLSALAGSTSQTFVETLIPNATLKTTPNYDEAVKMVVEDQANAMVADMEICVISVLRFPDAGLTTLTAPLTIEPIGIAVPPNDPLLLNLLENYLGSLEALGLLEELRAQWFENGAWLIQLP